MNVEIFSIRTTENRYYCSKQLSKLLFKKTVRYKKPIIVEITIQNTVEISRTNKHNIAIDFTVQNTVKILKFHEKNHNNQNYCLKAKFQEII